MIVVDASALLEEVLLQTPHATSVSERLFGAGDTLAAPHLIDIEIAQVLRRYQASGELEGPRAREALDDLTDMPLTRYPHDVLLPRVWELRHNLTAYDAA